MSSQSLHNPPNCIEKQQKRPILDCASFSTLPAPTSSLLPTYRNHFHCLSSQQETFKRSFAASRSGAQRFSFDVLVKRRPPSHHGRCLTVVCRSRSLEDSQLGDGPVEPIRPGFSRLPHSSLSFIPADDPAAAPLPPKKITISPRVKRQRRWNKATPAQAMAGALVGGLWAALALKGTTIAYEHLDSHPLAHDLPMGMTNNVNQILVTAVTGFGGFAVLMFSVSSFGLALLTLKLISTPKPPSQ